jgi:uncharacterized membrane protein YcgQ (UPF0703/DUF1980 family)
MKRFFSASALTLALCAISFASGCGVEPGGASLPPQTGDLAETDVLQPVYAQGDYVAPARAPEVDGVIEIREKMFIAQCNDIYLNPDEYLGKTVRIEGMYSEYAEEGGDVYYSVARLGPGCCGNDGVAGFEFTSPDLPDCELDDWICVEGVITPMTYDDGYETVIIGDAVVTLKAERGAEFVSQ